MSRSAVPALSWKAGHNRIEVEAENRFLRTNEARELMLEKRVKVQAAAERQEHEAIPFFLGSTGETAVWLAVTLGLILCLLAGMQVALHSPGVPLWAVLLVEVLYLAGLAIVVLVRLSLSRRVLLLGIGVILALGFGLGLTFANLLGYVLFELVPIVVVYRLPWRWSLPIMVLTAALFAALFLIRDAGLSGFAGIVIAPGSTSALSDLVSDLGLFVLVACIAGSLRSRSVLILQLRATQQRLQAEMEHTAELAAARERTRIARDIHDVLAHSLTMLSVQVQATRQLVRHHPEQAGHMLDEMAGVLRESIAESRRVVGMLREATQESDHDDTLRSRLLALGDRFAERTGMNCSLRETGQPQQLNDEQESALRFALQEALTNAYRHGGAEHVWADLAWQPEAVTLTVRDGGAGQPGLPPDGKGGNGLRGMRERAAALGGTLRAGPRDGGFEVSVMLPLTAIEAAQSSERSQPQAQTEAQA
jgi:signal transduction histidine kinase